MSNLAKPMNIIQTMKEGSIEELHDAVVNRRLDHQDLETIIHARIAAIPRLTTSRDGRWWSFPNAWSYPYGN